MKALVFRGARQMVLEDRDAPTVGADQVLVRVRAAGICGSELEAYSGSSTRRQPPLILGHEIAVTVDGSDDDLLYAVNPLTSCGVCRMCQTGFPNRCAQRLLLSLQIDGGHAELLAVDADALTPLVGVTDPALAALVEPLATSVNALGGPEQVQGLRVAVVGCGTLGLMAVRLAALWGAEAVAASDLNDERLSIAQDLGATSLMEDPRARFDLVLDMVGSDVTRRTSIALADRGATVKLVGLSCADSPLPVVDVISGELTLVGVYAYTPAHFAIAAGMIAADELKLDRIVTRASLSEGPGMFERLANDPQSLVKVVLEP